MDLKEAGEPLFIWARICLSDELCSHLNEILPLSILGFLKLMNNF